MINVEKGILTSIVLLISLYNLSLFLSKAARREDESAQMCPNIICPFGSLKLNWLPTANVGLFILTFSFKNY